MYPRVSPLITAVHPHVRGDNPIRSPALETTTGSPPRAWGQRHARFWSRHRHWFTPTCVGTTTSTQRSTLYRAVHPHVRGDNTPGALLLIPHAGSPPRAWGQRMGTARA